MPRSIATALAPLLDLSWLETFTTLEIAFPDGQVKRWAGGYVAIPGQAPYLAGVIRSEGLTQSMGAAVDVVSVTLENIDWWHSLTLLKNVSRSLAPAIVGRLHRDFRAGQTTWVWRALLRGVVGAPVTNEAEATYTVISDIAAAGLVGATRSRSRPCGWKFRGEECGYTGSLLTCDLTYDKDSGCKGRNRQWRFGGYVYDNERMTLPGA